MSLKQEPTGIFGSVCFGSGFGRFLEFRFGFVNFLLLIESEFLYTTLIRDFKLSDSDTRYRNLIKREQYIVYTVL